jgi:tetratricopeptide (TPR) repeat protein
MNFGVFLADFDSERGLAEGLRAYKVMHDKLGDAHPDIINLMNNIGNAYLDLDRPQDAKLWITRAFEIERKVYPPGDRRFETAHENLCGLLADTGEREAAIAEANEALRLIEARGAGESADAGYPLGLIGKIELAMKRPKAALVALERAMRLPPRQLPHRGEIAYPLAKAVWETSHDRARVASLLALARADYSADTPEDRAWRQDIDEWDRRTLNR